MKAERVPAHIPYHSGPPRSDGVHVSSIIRLVAGDYGILPKEWVEDLSLIEVSGNAEKWWNKLDQVSQIRMSLGLAWEQFYLPLLPGVVHQPGEMQLNSIYMTHDGESLDVVTTPQGPRYKKILHEVKVTYKSTKTIGEIGAPHKGISPTWMWEAQVKAYAKALNCLDVMLHILYPCGDYLWPIRPQLHVWKLHFEQAEIDESWEFFVDYLRCARLENTTPDFDGKE